jgi:uncharacterized SAM-binding protein YcdF (DUF218 family)
LKARNLLREMSRSWKILVPALGVMLIIFYFYRYPILSAMGEYLYDPTSLEKADLIVALGGNRWRQRDAVALMKEGLAEYILLLGPDVQQSDYNCLGVSRERAILPHMPAYTTGDEALETLKIMRERSYKSAIVVTSWYHLRRASLTFGRVFDGETIKLMFHPSGHTPFDYKTWWRSYIGRKAVVIEYLGLATYWVRY